MLTCDLCSKSDNSVQLYKVYVEQNPQYGNEVLCSKHFEMHPTCLGVWWEDMVGREGKPLKEEDGGTV